MRYSLPALLFASLIFQHQCATPEQVHDKFQDGLQEYFAHAKVIMAHDQQTIFGLTCIYGAADKLVEFTGQQMKEKTKGELERAAIQGLGYRYVIIGFDTRVIFIDLKTEKMVYENPIVNPQTPNWARDYQHDCPIQSADEVPDGVCDNCKN